jgi:8-amino-3,8-dideoxy-alpha-D-manno-octulosonate transaminase
MSKQRLALQGGLKAVTRIEGKGQPKIGLDEFMSVAERFGFKRDTLRKIRAVVEKADTGEGPFLANYYSDLKETKVKAYERAAREIFGVKYATGVSSGTGALHSSFVAAGVGPGTEVICPAIGFFATAAAVVMAKGVPVFCDVDTSLHMDPGKLESLITKRTVAVAPTCVMGGVPDMDPILKIARRHKLKVVEDCAQSCGATYKGRYLGTLGDLGCFSISAYKIVGGGEGGLFLTNDKRLWERASCLAEGGGLWRTDRFAPQRYEGELFCGTNYRMSELEAAVDVVQLRKAPAIARRFRAVKQRIVGRLKTFKEIVPQRSNDPAGEVGYFLRFFPRSVELAEKIVAALKAEGVACGTRGKNPPPDWHIYRYMYPLMSKPNDANCALDCPKYIEHAGCRMEYGQGQCPVADDLFDRVVTVQLNQWFSARDCRNVAEGINKALSAYCTEDRKAAKWC